MILYQTPINSKEEFKLKFLIKIEEAIDAAIIKLLDKIKSLIPTGVFAYVEKIKTLPQTLKTLWTKSLQPKLKIRLLKTIGYFEHYTTLVRGHIVNVQIYLRSEEFKKKNKVEMILSPLKKFKTDPVKAFSVALAITFFGGTSYYIFKNTAKIISGTKALRSPASQVEEEPILELKNVVFNVLQDKELILDITIYAKDTEERDKLIPIEKEIETHLKGIPIVLAALPPTKEEIAKIEKNFLKNIEGAKIKSVHIKQKLNSRPAYFLQTEKLSSFKDINLQLFLEDTKRNRQVWVDFTALSSNRNIALYLKENEIEIRDFINMNVEPVIPQLPIEEEGRQIIKDKIKLELNEYLKLRGIEGKILEIYVDYIIVS
jgi:hypothetical protein